MKISVKDNTPAEAAAILLEHLGSDLKAMKQARERAERASAEATHEFYNQVQKELIKLNHA